MARERAVIASHTTVGVAARRRPITRACLLGLLVFWWSWARGASSAEAAPDLVGSSLRVISSYGSYSRVEWIGRNQGPDATAGGWTDYVYISPRSACCAEAILLGTFAWPPQSAPVAPGATYTHEATVQIPPLPLGNYYLIARVNASGSFAETNTANNVVATPFRIAPHVDLSPVLLTAPASATTQQSISVSWTVDNFVSPFPEDATADLWQDNLYISAESDVLRGRNLSRELVPRGRTDTQRSIYPDADRHGARSPGGRLLRHRADRRHGRPGGDRRGQCALHADPDHDAGPRAHVAPRSRRVGGGVGPAGHLGILDGVEPGDGADARVLAGQPVHLAEPHVLRGRDAAGDMAVADRSRPPWELSADQVDHRADPGGGQLLPHRLDQRHGLAPRGGRRQ